MTIIPMILAMTVALGGVFWVIFFSEGLGGEVRGSGAPPPPGETEAKPKLTVIAGEVDGTVKPAEPSSDSETSRAA